MQSSPKKAIHYYGRRKTEPNIVRTYLVNSVSLQQLLPGGYSSCTKDLSIDDSGPVDAILDILFSFGLLQRTTNLGDLFVATSGLDEKKIKSFLLKVMKILRFKFPLENL